MKLDILACDILAWKNFHVKAAMQKKSLQDFEIINPLRRGSDEVGVA